MPAYDNAAVAVALEDYSDLLEIAGEDRYRFLSYRKAAQAVRAWDEDIMSTALSGRLTAIPGIGARIAAGIESLLQTGGIPGMADITARVPASVVELTRVPGLGPRRAKALFDAFSIASIADLEEAIVQGRLDGAPGFGPKTIEHLVQGIERYRSLSARILLADALPLAEAFVKALRALPGVADVAFTGSVRRMKETVGDVDVLVAAEDAAAVIDAVRDLATVTDVVGAGDARTSVMTTAGRQVDVQVVSPECWGTALQYSTGSTAHNARLREIAGARGIDLSERGVFVRETGERLPCRTERDVYEALGMVEVPAEIREDTGEIELAVGGRTPDLVSLEDIRGDLHAHTTATDGRSTLEQNRERARDLGYEYLGCSDHAFELRMVGGLSVEQVEAQWALIDGLNARDDGGPVLLKSIELNIDDEGGVDYPDEFLARFDYCVASLHHGFEQPRERVTERLLVAMQNPYVDIIGHPTGRLLGRRDPFDLDMEAVIAAAARTGTILELNAHPERLDLNDAHLRMARAQGVRIAIDTDAHEAMQFGHLRWGIATARRGWIASADVLNAQPLEVMRSWLKRNRA